MMWYLIGSICGIVSIVIIIAVCIISSKSKNKEEENEYKQNDSRMRECTWDVSLTDDEKTALNDAFAHSMTDCAVTFGNSDTVELTSSQKGRGAMITSALDREKVTEEIERYLGTAKALENKLRYLDVDSIGRLAIKGCSETAALRRASHDLSAALIQLRRR